MSELSLYYRNDHVLEWVHYDKPVICIVVLLTSQYQERDWNPNCIKLFQWGFSVWVRDSRPVAFAVCREHGPHAPAWAKDIERLGKAIVIDDPGVDREKPH